MSTALVLRDLGTERDPDRFIPPVLPWILEAGDPLFGWLLGERALAARIERWMRRPSSEVAIARTTIGQLDDLLIGGYVAVDGAALPTCRIADAVASFADADDVEALRARMEASRALFKPVSADDFYLSKLGVLPMYRGRGFGRRLIERFIEHGRARGFDRFRLDVFAQNQRAIELYRLFGFQAVSVGVVPGTPLEYLAMTLRPGAQR